MDKFFLALLNKLDQLDEKIGHQEAVLRWGKRAVNGLIIALLIWVVLRALPF